MATSTNLLVSCVLALKCVSLRLKEGPRVVLVLPSFMRAGGRPICSSLLRAKALLDGSRKSGVAVLRREREEAP